MVRVDSPVVGHGGVLTVRHRLKLVQVSADEVGREAGHA